MLQEEEEVNSLKKGLAYTILILFLTILFNLLEYGLQWDRLDQYMYPGFLAVVTLTSFIKKNFRRKVLILFLITFFSMIVVYLVNDIPLADSLGGFAFALLCINFISYFPGLIKNGYIEKL